MYNVLTNEMPAGAHERITGTELEPLSKFLPNIPPLIEAAIMKSLELNINLRQQSIAELAQVLDLVQSGSDSAATVSVANIGTTGAPTTVADGVDLPSVQIPSALSSSAGDTHASIRVEQPDAPTPASTPKRSQGVIYGLIGAVIAVLGGGYLFLGGEEKRDSQTMQQVGTQAPGTEIAGATAPAGTSPAINSSAGGLPSIFSNEQATAPPTDNANSDEPLLDVFERHRDDELAKAPASTTPPDKPKRVNTTGNSGGKPGYDVTDPRAWNPVVH
jgi:serine/threonine-protein kinase